MKWVLGSVDSDAFVSQLVELEPDAVIHLAGLQIPTCRQNPVLGARVNVIGTLNVFEAAKALKAAGKKPFSIVYASSAAIFGPDEDYHQDAVNDSSAPMPASHYGAFKLCDEHSARAYHIANGLSSVGLRPLSVYGPGRDAGLTSFPSRAIAAAVAGVPFEIPFSGPTCYTHIREVRTRGAQAAFRRITSSGPALTSLPRLQPCHYPSAGGGHLRVVRAQGGGRRQGLHRGRRHHGRGGLRGHPRQGPCGRICRVHRTYHQQLAPFRRITLAHPSTPCPALQILPGAASRIAITGGTIPIASKIDDAALRADVPGLVRIPLHDGIAESVADFQRLHGEGRLTV